jgi:hypothetical protein
MNALAATMDSRDLDDPAVVRRLARQMGHEMGVETGQDMADEMEALVEADRTGDDEARGGGNAAGADDGRIY